VGLDNPKGSFTKAPVLYLGGFIKSDHFEPAINSVPCHSTASKWNQTIPAQGHVQVMKTPEELRNTLKVYKSKDHTFSPFA
jgi:hypothetical protein